MLHQIEQNHGFYLGHLRILETSPWFPSNICAREIQKVWIAFRLRCGGSWSFYFGGVLESASNKLWVGNKYITTLDSTVCGIYPSCKNCLNTFSLGPYPQPQEINQKSQPRWVPSIWSSTPALRATMAAGKSASATQLPEARAMLVQLIPRRNQQLTWPLFGGIQPIPILIRTPYSMNHYMLVMYPSISLVFFTTIKKKGPDNPTCQLLPTSSKRKVKMAWEMQEREKRWWRIGVCNKEPVCEQVVCE